jgi:hypothetical protein
VRKLLATLALITLALAGCNRGGDDGASDPTDEPEATASINAAADFALVGTIDEAFRGEEPDIELPTSGTDLDDAGATAEPSPVGGTPAEGGVLRIVLDDASEDLTEACGLDTDDIAIVYWTTNTFFEPTTVLDDIEDEIEEETAGITGTIYRSGDADIDASTPGPTEAATTSPLATTSPASTGRPGPVFDDDNDCVLVAEQLGFTTTLPTPRPRATAAPPAATATPRRTATPIPTRTPTPPPATSSPSTTASAQPTAS